MLSNAAGMGIRVCLLPSNRILAQSARHPVPPVQQAFLRALDTAGAVTPERPAGGHRRYTRRQLAFAGRVRELFDQGHNLVSALRILGLQDDVAGLQDDLAAERALTASLQASFTMSTQASFIVSTLMARTPAEGHGEGQPARAGTAAIAAGVRCRLGAGDRA